jgi:chaperone required for assembly of F1-ATPase
MMSRRFYKTVSIAGEEAPFTIHLDGKAVHTPLKSLLDLPGRNLAEAVASEWRAQNETIDPATMPLTRLANTAIDRVDPNRSRVIDEIVKFAGSDLVCYRASAPERLRERQATAWDDVLTWAHQALDANLTTASGIVFRDQPPGALAGIRSYLVTKSSWELAAIHNLTTLTGSALLALMVAAGAKTGEAAWSAAHVDEDWQNEHWGVDEEAQARRAAHRRDFDATLTFLSLLG